MYLFLILYVYYFYYYTFYHSCILLINYSSFLYLHVYSSWDWSYLNVGIICILSHFHIHILYDLILTAFMLGCAVYLSSYSHRAPKTCDSTIPPLNLLPRNAVAAPELIYNERLHGKKKGRNEPRVVPAQLFIHFSYVVSHEWMNVAAALKLVPPLLWKDCLRRLPTCPVELSFLLASHAT